MIIETNVGISGNIIYNTIKDKHNFFIGRMPGIEAATIYNHIFNKKIPEHLKLCIQQNTGFYCLSDNFDDILKKWCDIYLKALRSCDLLYRLEFPTWYNLVKDYYQKIYVFSCASLHLWMTALQGKNITAQFPIYCSVAAQQPA